MTNDVISELYQTHHNWLQHWIYQRLGCHGKAADIAQDAFVRILTVNNRQALPPLQRPRAYLCTIAGRLLTDHFRRQSLEHAYQQVLSLQPEAVIPSEMVRLEILETLQTLDTALSRLKGDIRKAFLLSQLEGLTYAQIALELKVSERTIKRYITRALTICIMCMESE